MRKGDVDQAALRDLVARIFPSGEPCAVERTEEGVSTQIYRIRRGSETFYLRVAEERAASLAPEVWVHRELRARGVKAPDVVYYTPWHGRLERSVMVTTEIHGAPVRQAPLHMDTREILRSAGRDMAMMNSIAVVGFGWVRRDLPVVTALAAEHATYKGFLLEQFDEHLTRLREGALTAAETAIIAAIVERHASWLESVRGYLAHGDLDLTHIYQCAGHYTGIIDFGEIRGADPLYDLGHFNLHDGEVTGQKTLPYILVGYREITALPADCEQRIRFISLLIGVRALARSLQGPAGYQRHLAAAIRRALAVLNR